MAITQDTEMTGRTQIQIPSLAAPTLKRIHVKRHREVYRYAGWPYQDVVEIDLLAAGLLERTTNGNGHHLVRLTDAGISHLA